MKWLLILWLYNGDDGGHVAVEKVEMKTEVLCKEAQKKFKKIYKGQTWHRKNVTVCIKVK